MTILKQVDHSVLGKLNICLYDSATDSEIAHQLSKLLSSCALMLSEAKGGHVPDEIVKERILKYYTTVDSIANINCAIASRFFISDGETVLATALVANTPGVLMPEETHSIHFDSFDASSKKMEISKFHSVFNIAVDINLRKIGLARLLMDFIIEQKHTFFSGDGLYLRSEPPEHDIWLKLGFEHVSELDQFFLSKISPSIKFENIIEYNSKFSCQCHKTSEWLIDVSVKKLKYYGFIRNF